MAQPDRPADLCLEMFSQPRLLSALRAAIGHLAQRVGFDEHHAGQVSLAVDEAVCNVINHGYSRAPHGRIKVHVWADDDGDGERPALHIVIEDDAVQVDPDKIRSRDLDDVRPGGLGVHIIREIMDEAVYEKRHEGGMRLTLVKRLPDDADAAAAKCTGHEGEAH